MPLLPKPPYSLLGPITLYYSYAITTNSCINVNPDAKCGENVYDYWLYSCNETCPNPVAKHNSGEICAFPIDEVQSCVDGTRYMCAITGPGPDPPKNDAYIEWHWSAVYKYDVFPQTVTGKFIFVASAAYIKSQYDLHGYGGINPPYGIGMFNPSNHNS